MYWLNNHVRSGCGGKGAFPSQAEAGALCEAVERYCLTWHGDQARIQSSLNQLGDRAIHPNACMNFSRKQFRDRNKSNEECAKFYAMVPVPFDESVTMDWSPVWSVTRNCFKYLPTCFCYAQYPVEDEKNALAYPDSNGCAAGNSIEEAALQGFLELVERDGVAIWWYNRLKRPRVDIRSFDNPYFNSVLDYYPAIHRELIVLDLTTDLNIPTFGAISRKNNGGRQDVIFGFGAHVDATIAVERALLEINQLLPIVCPNSEPNGKATYLTDDQSFLDWLASATFENQPYLSPRRDVPAKTCEDYPPLCEADIYESLRFCVNTVEQRGLEVLLLDMTRPDIGLNVVKVIVPGMRHFWKRTAPGRLYDVPVEMGWLNEPLSEEQLNPVGLFI
jgi:ribosomal protein S12 methylthiotransferase accessory factor